MLKVWKAHGANQVYRLVGDHNRSFLSDISHFTSKGQITILNAFLEF